MQDSDLKFFLQKLLIELDTFPNRTNDLQKVTRYSNYSVMWYRTNLWTHSKHVFFILWEMMPLIIKHFPHVDQKRMLAMTLIHDDAEIITGDFQSGDKFCMTEEQRAQVDKDDVTGANAIADRYPETIGDYNYRELLLEAVELFTMESRIVKYCDKFDGLGEAFHEVFAGNDVFTRGVHNEYGNVPSPLQYYHRYFMEFPRDNEDLRPWLRENHPIFRLFNLDDTIKRAETGKPHTKESLLAETDHLQYDWWKGVMLRSEDDELLDALTTQTES